MNGSDPLFTVNTKRQSACTSSAHIFEDVTLTRVRYITNNYNLLLSTSSSKKHVLYEVTIRLARLITSQKQRSDNKVVKSLLIHVSKFIEKFSLNVYLCNLIN